MEYCTDIPGKEKIKEEIEALLKANHFSERRGPYNTRTDYAGDMDVGSYVDRRYSGKTFRDTLLDFQIEKNISDPDVYSAAKLDRKHYNKLINNVDTRPTKETVEAIGIALRLTPAEFNILMSSAGYTLSRSIRRDVIVEYFLLNKIFDIDIINDTLYSFGERTLSRF